MDGAITIDAGRDGERGRERERERGRERERLRSSF